MHPVITVFIASPSDLSKERARVEAAVQELAPRLVRRFGIALVPLRWEQFAPISTYDGSHPQTAILRQIKPLSIFVGIVGDTCGTPIGPDGQTGIEMELEHAQRHRPRIPMLCYFKEREATTGDETEEQAAERRRVEKLENRLREQNVLLATYASDKDFGRRISGDLMEAVLELVLTREPREVGDYLEFFHFGAHPRIGTLPVMIVYPPMTDPGPGHHRPKLNWQQRLLPHVIYEDFKAIQDVEEVMRLIGREYKTVTTDAPEVGMAPFGDRVWVCVPRNRKAQQVLKDLGGRVRFRFDPRSTSDGKDELVLSWRGRDVRWLEIRSPLAKYLEGSNRRGKKVPWKPLYGYIYGKDYAILARFQVLRDRETPGSESCYHYFIGGIRGLGTWGAGHLIDHESARLVKMAEASMRASEETAEARGVVPEPETQDDVQLLLEITYKDYRIIGVKDVSDQGQAYFDERFSDEFVQRRLKSHDDWLPPF